MVLPKTNAHKENYWSDNGNAKSQITGKMLGKMSVGTSIQFQFEAILMKTCACVCEHKAALTLFNKH